MAYAIKLAGQDITNLINHPTLKIVNNLGQGPGLGGGASGRASTCDFEAALGAAQAAVGAGTTISTPKLVRQGVLQVYDGTTLVFGGRLVKLSDTTQAKSNFVQVSATDYWSDLAGITINEVFSGQTDIQIITALITKYAPWIDLSLLPAVANYTFSVEQLIRKTLQAGLQDVCDKAGQVMWIGPDAKLRYSASNSVAQAAFSVVDSGADFRTKFYSRVLNYDIDDTAIVNRVYFYGGKQITPDFTQDLSTQANGSNTTFVLAYFPHESSDGKLHLFYNGVEQIFGTIGGNVNDVRNKFISQGGVAVALLNRTARAISWDPGGVIPSNLGPGTLTFKYRYELPLAVVVTDPVSFAFFGRYRDSTIADANVFDTRTAIQRCRILLAEQSMGLTTLKFEVYVPGLQIGTVVRVDHNVRDIHANFLIQSVEIQALGHTQFRYTISCGAWHWNVVDILKQIARNTSLSDPNQDTVDQPIAVPTIPTTNLSAAWSVVKATRTQGGYYPRLTAVGDGHDAYPGLASV